MSSKPDKYIDWSVFNEGKNIQPDITVQVELRMSEKHLTMDMHVINSTAPKFLQLVRKLFKQNETMQSSDKKPCMHSAIWV